MYYPGAYYPGCTVVYVVRDYEKILIVSKNATAPRNLFTLYIDASASRFGIDVVFFPPLPRGYGVCMEGVRVVG